MLTSLFRRARAALTTTHAPDCTCDSCETAIRRVFGQVVLPSPFATFRQQTAELLGFEADAPTSDILAALRMRNRRIADLERRWSDAAALADSLLHRLDAVRACLLADDVDGAKLLLSEAAPGAEGTHGAAEETKEVSRG